MILIFFISNLDYTQQGLKDLPTTKERVLVRYIFSIDYGQCDSIRRKKFVAKFKNLVF